MKLIIINKENNEDKFLAFPEEIKSCINRIKNIALNYFEKGEDKSPYSIADFMICIHQIEHLANLVDDKYSISMINTAFTELKSKTSNSWEQISECYETRKRQFEEELKEEDPYEDDEKPIGLLKKYIKEKGLQE